MIAEKPVAQLAAGSAPPSVEREEQIRQRAYQLYEQRGCEHGHDVEDWLIAEREMARPEASQAA
jgi:hypothetical protein